MRALALPLLAAGCHSAWEGEFPPADAAVPLVPADVDPFVGTAGPGFRVGSATPAATVPFGTVKLGPDTTAESSWVSAYHCSGYYHDDPIVRGFSHLHMHGVGIADLGSVLFQPTDGFDASKTSEPGYEAYVDKASEAARPGYYGVRFESGISAEVSATMHAGHHRYRFPEGVDPVVVIDLEHVLNGQNAGGEVHVDAVAGVVEGYMTNAGGFTGGDNAFRVYFHAVFDGGIAGFGTWGDGDPVEGQVEAAGIDLGAWVRPVGDEAVVRVGISLVDLDGARANLEAELPSQPLEDTVAAADALWADALARFEIEGAGDDRVRFATSVYHLLQMPTQYSDADGRYVGFDDVVHTAHDFTWHSDFSLWDTYRTAHPAFTLFYPEKARDFAISLLRMAEQGGAFPRWPVAGGEASTMLGAPADIALADTWIKGVRGWDIDAAWPRLRAQALGEGEIPYNGRPEVATLERLGYLPSDLVGSSVAWTMELAWADWALAQLASAIGAEEDAAHFAWRAHTYRNVYDPQVGFFHGRSSDGSFDDLDPFAWAPEYTEGNAWQYLWLAPQDPDGLAALLGGEAVARARLEEFFEGAKLEGVHALPPSWYWHGNEPDIHAAYLFALWGDLQATADQVTWITDTHYAVDPHGLAGNDDAGTLSAWYIFSGLGFYPIAGTTQYVLGVPRFPVARFAVDGGWFEVRREGEGSTILGVEIDGVAIEGAVIRHEMLRAGSVIVFLMG